MKARSSFRLERAVVTVVGALTVVVIGLTLRDLFTYYPYQVDLEIPLRAATRWVNGGQPYLPGAFDVIAGPDLPFLYPPIVLPILAPLLVVPIQARYGWRASFYVFGILGVVWAVAWYSWYRDRPPFAEALLGGNIQVPLFAAFTAVLYRGGGAPFRPRPRDPRDPDRPAPVDGLLATLIGAIKVSLVHTWLFVLRRRPRAALLGAAIVIGFGVLTLPLVGIERWADWIGQAGRWWRRGMRSEPFLYPVETPQIGDGSDGDPGSSSPRSHWARFSSSL